VPYSSKFLKTKKAQDLAKKRIKDGDFKILITTTNFLYKNFTIFPGGVFNLLFIDDVDSILKKAKHIDKIIYLLGFNENDIKKTEELINLKRLLINKKIEENEENLKKLNDLKSEIENIKEKRKGVLIVSSATSNPKSSKILLFRELFDFEIGRTSVSLRNIAEIYENSLQKDLYSLSLEKIKELGNGGLIFLPGDKTKEDIKEYVDFLNKNGVKAISYEEIEKKLASFKRGKIKVVVGFSSFKNPIARGLDLPETVRYALFVGVPKIKINLRLDNFKGIYYFLLSLLPVLTKRGILSQEENLKIYRYLKYIENFLYLEEDKIPKTKLNKIEKIVEEIKNIFLNEEIIKKIEESKDARIKKEDNLISIYIPDVVGYIQASGRTSRLYLGGLTKGLSYLIIDDEILFESLRKKLSWISDEFEFKRREEVSLDEIIKEIDLDRIKIKKAKIG
ncbi:MAG: reverse gyrase, partial [Caldisericia bacterium]|nr:reverse gyrase [Caldisericia bacterium]